MQYDPTTHRLFLLFTPSTTTTDTQPPPVETLRRIELGNDDGYMEILETPGAVDLIKCICLNRVMATRDHPVEGIVYNEQSDVLIILFARQNSDNPSHHSFTSNDDFGLTLRKVHNCVYSLRLGYLAHCYDDVRAQLLDSDTLWKTAFAASSRLILDERRSNKKLRAKPREIVYSVMKSRPKNHEAIYCDYCLLFFKRDPAMHQCVLCEDCEAPALTVWDGYVCRDCSKHEKKRCYDALGLINPVVTAEANAI